MKHTYDEISIKNANVRLSIVDGKVFDIRIEGKNDIEIDNTKPLRKGKIDKEFNTMDYEIQIEPFEYVKRTISIIKWCGRV